MSVYAVDMAGNIENDDNGLGGNRFNKVTITVD